jgi:hypothetical protein
MDQTPGTKHHQPIQTLLQKEITINGRTEYRVQTLIGLACRSQFSSDKPNTFAIFRSNVIQLFLLPTQARNMA